MANKDSLGKSKEDTFFWIIIFQQQNTTERFRQNMMSSSYKISQAANIHHYKLFYLHSTSQQQPFQRYQRFMTQRKPNSIHSSEKLFQSKDNKPKHSSLIKKPCVAETPKNKGSSSQNTIHYFELDLKNMVSKNEQKEEKSNKIQKSQEVDQKEAKLIMNNFLNSLNNRVQNREAKVKGINDLQYLLQKSFSTSKTGSNNQNLFSDKKEKIEVKKSDGNPKIYHKINLCQKVKEPVSTKQQFQLKYKRLQNSKRQSNIGKGIYRMHQKGKISKENIRSELQTKRIQKMIVDNNGNEFKVTIQKVK